MTTTFTLSQTPASINLYLYPNDFKAGTGTSGFVASTGTNYECVDETWNSPNEDTDYVYTISQTTVLDLYELPDHTTEAGTINYVQVLARSRCTYGQQVSGSSYRIIMDVSGVTAKSPQLYPVTQSYTNYSNTWTSTPSGQSWTWDAVDNLRIGFEGNSQFYSGDVDLVLNPTSGTTQCHFGGVGCEGAPTAQGYLNIVGADDTTYLYDKSGSTATAIWHIDSTSITGWTINNVTFYYRVKEEETRNWKVNLKIFRSDTTYTVGAQSMQPTYQTYTYVAETDPATGSAWTWDGVKTMEVGVQFEYVDTTGQNNISRLYVIVNYTVNCSHELRTTQCNALVNYSPSATTVTLNQPSNLQVSHSRQVSRHTFPTGSYEVDDYGRAGKTLTLNGQETSTATVTMQGLKDMVHYGAVVTVAGLDDPNLNTDYHIADFSFSQEAGMQNRYYWSLQLEED